MKKTELNDLTLSSGSHSGKDGQCLMEACAMIAGETKGDHPACVYAPFAAAGRVINDAEWESDEARTEHLKKYIPLMIGTSHYANNPAVAVAVAQCAAKVARKFADNFDPKLTSSQRIAQNGPELLDALLAAAESVSK